MFAELNTSSDRLWRAALLISFALHGIVLLLLSHHAPAGAVLPQEVALGTPYSSGSVIYLAPLGREKARDTESLEIRTTKPKSELALKSKAKPVAPQREQASMTHSSALEITARAGSPYGSHTPGTPLTGDAVLPALPQVFPDPPVSRTDLPAGVEGDVIVEVTIDEHGSVVELRLTKGIGFGIDEKVMAVLRHWRFTPATRNGVSIASQHLVHFHYPA